MRKPIIISSIVVSTVFANAQVYCPPVCCGGGSQSYLTVTLMGMGNLTRPRGWIEIAAHQFSTTQDGCESSIEYLVKRDCSNLPIGPRMPGSGKNWTCIVICGADCPEHIACNGCPGLFSHGCGDFSYYFELAGRGDFIVKYNGVEVFRQHFDFGGGLDYFISDFCDIRFLNKDFSNIQSNDIFDALESVGIEVEAEFLGDDPPPAVGVILRSDISQDTLVIDVSLDQAQQNTAMYSGILDAGLFQLIIGDPDDVLPPYSEAEISAQPIPIECPGQPTLIPPVDILPIANFQIFVQEISFESDHDLFEDGPAPQPDEVRIEDPVWIRNTKNKPVAYTRSDTLLINAQFICNRTPYHDFEYSVMGTGGNGQGNYITEIYEGHFNGTSVGTITGISPRDGAFPDYVGIINPLTYNWWVKKIPEPDPNAFRFANTSTHEIFLTYDSPLLDTVNVLGLRKICDYAQDENQDTVIAELGVGGVYAERWDYNPSKIPIFDDPLDVIRQKVGICADYANLLTYLYRAIGIQANSVTIYNGCVDVNGIKYWLKWKYTYEPLDWTCLLSNLLTSCDNETKYWAFSYHAVSYAAGKLCDASLGIIDAKINYSEWWRYYLQPAELYRPDPPPPPPPPPPYVHTEPPTFEPTYYDWFFFIPEDEVLPLNILEERVFFFHPY